HAPSQPQDWDAWRKGLLDWRRAARVATKHDDSLYRLPEYKWVPSSFVANKILLWDETFYDPTRNQFRVDEYVATAKKRFGGFDDVLLWHSYPRLGFDERNQFDFYRDMPGGLAGLRRVVKQFHRHGIRVKINYNPWDVGTRREGKSDQEALLDIVRAIDADGIYLDTMHEAPRDLLPALRLVKPGAVLDTENPQCGDRLGDHHTEWLEEHFEDSAVPGVVRNKWLERRHMVHIGQRQSRDRTSFLHAAWMNGTGVLVWENIFGMWNGFTRRDEFILRVMSPVQRRYAELFSSEDWTPLTPVLSQGVYASLWRNQSGQQRIWTLVNREEREVRGEVFQVPYEAGVRWLDLVQGTAAKTRRVNHSVVIETAIGPRGVGGILALAPGAQDPGLQAFLDSQRKLQEGKAALQDAHWTPPARQWSTPEPTLPNAGEPAKGMRRVPAANKFKLQIGDIHDNVWSGVRPGGSRESIFVVNDIPITNGEFLAYVRGSGVRPRDPRHYLLEYLDKVLPPDLAGAPVKGINTAEARAAWKWNGRVVNLAPYDVDEQPVTNGEFLRFMEATRYRPRHAENFLRHWRAGRPAPGDEGKPVVYVDLDDARAYARWNGKRLPTEEEWVYAFERGAARRGAARVWEWNGSVSHNGQTRWVQLHGGSDYQAQGSRYYAPGGVQDFRDAAQFILMWPGLDRCSTIGFRCVRDSPAKPN
ncbi:MAG TPA: SUMF1/EgtB/PvdO family nonheme iron enzyme, partial [Bryobacteraceae bacterium]|nr:SUMF1/EgtB/PvdO family nonheme iron enzyme [Bryobacteraceae bacterium]